jgi:hypothetical protein
MKYALNTWKSMENKDFVVFILTHGRPDKVKTLSTLIKCGYTGKYCLVIDNQDPCLNEYIENYGEENIKVFDKQGMVASVDNGNNFGNTDVILYARNACFDIARKMGVTYFMELDDDYYYFGYRYDTGARIIKNIDAVFDSMLNFYKSVNIKSIAFSQGGDHIGGFSGIKLLRKCMNSFLCSTKRQFDFVGSLNEDVNTYITLGHKGDVFFTFTNIQLDQKDTQSNSGGMTEQYQLSGTYIKSFQSVVMHPSGTRVSMMNSANTRIHHTIKWKHTAPKILSDKYKLK